MAIKRCPYCKAIIDESSGYCSNCGTQLLFPEDEFIEEEIPGEKIVDEDTEEEEKESAEPNEATNETEVKEEEEFEPPSEKAENIESSEEPVLEEPALEEEAEDVEEDSSITPQSGEEQVGEIEQLSPEAPPNTGKKFEDLEEEPLPTPQDIEGEQEERKEPPPVTPPDLEAEAASAEEPQEAFVFKTEELEEMVDPADKEKEDIERFLDSIKKEREEEIAQEKLEEDEATPDFSEIKSKISDTGDELPPWAEKIKESTSDMDSFSEDEETEFEPADTDEEFTSEKEMDYEARTPTFDSGVGIPERVSQKSLPFEDKRRKKLKRMKKKRPITAVNWLKSKAFDFLFIGAFWLIALWFASRVMEVSLFQLISASVLPILVFYVILLLSYFILFLYFLGETIGEHLFSEED